MSYRDIPHAAVNELMQWVRKRGKHAISLRAWPHLVRRSVLPDWDAHIDVDGATPLHARIQNRGSKVAVIAKPNTAICPVCSDDSALLSSPAASQSASPKKRRLFKRDRGQKS